MERMKASDFPQELLNLFDRYVHGDIPRRDFLDGIVNIWFLAPLHVLASEGAQPGEDDVGVDKRRGVAAVVARPNVQAPTTSPAWRPARYLVIRSAFAPLSTNTQASWIMCSFVWPGWTRCNIEASE